jgi:hypothetical protein
VSIRDLKAAAAAAMGTAETARQRFTGAAFKLWATGSHLVSPGEPHDGIRAEFDAAAKAHLEAQDQVRKALEALDVAQAFARQRRERRSPR